MKISVVITAYNVQEYIKECIDSVLAQNVKCEIVVVEDKSTDNTLEILKSYKDKIVLVENSVNVGPGLSRRYGIQVASGEYVLLLDGDDYLEQDFIKLLSDAAEESGADIVSGGIKILNEDGTWKAESYGNCEVSGNDQISRFWGERIVFMNNKLIRRSLYEKVPYSDRRYVEDTPTIIPILWYSNKTIYVDTIGYVYRMRPTSLTHTSNILKDIVYKGLCWFDLMEFFSKNDPTVFEAVNIKGFCNNIILTLNKITFDQSAILPFRKEWEEFTIKLFNTLVITQANFKVNENNK